MLKKFNGSKFVQGFSSEVVSYYRSKTDKRFVLDVVAPGFAASDVDVQISPDCDAIKVILDPSRRPPLDVDGDPDNFGYNAIKMANGTVEQVFDIDPEIYNLDTIQVVDWSGVIRISVLKAERPWGSVCVGSGY